MKPILVVSYPRSGTHFLIDSIRHNLPSIRRWRDLPPGWAELQPDCIYKSHAGSWTIPDAAERFRVLYIVRDLRDVMTSMWHYHCLHPKIFQCSGSVAEHAFRQDWPNNYGQPAANRVEAWFNHVSGWPVVVRYEHLNLQFASTIQAVFAHLGEEVPKTPSRPPLGGIDARKGVVGDWTNHLSQADSECIRQQVGDLRRYLWP